MFQHLRHLIVVVSLSMLAACGGGKTADFTVTVDPTASGINSPAFNTLSSFKITGNNLRYATPLNTSGCASDMKILGVNNGEMVIQCTPTATTIKFAVYDSTLKLVDTVTAEVPRPSLAYTITSITPDTSITPAAQLGAASVFNVVGDSLYDGIVAITSEDCLNLFVQISATQPKKIVKIQCLPTSATPTFKVQAFDNAELLSTFVADFNALPQAPVTVLADKPSTVGTKNYYQISGYFAGASDILVAADNCSNIAEQTFTPKKGTFVFSCTPDNLDVTFDVADQNGTTIASVPMPIQVGIEMKVGDEATASKTLLVNLDIQNAPVSVRNFLAYVDSGYYKSDDNGTPATIVHRIEQSSTFALIQGGAFTAKEDINVTVKPGAFAPIVLENTSQTGLSNTSGTIAMARTRGFDSATSQFYFNISDNADSLDYKSDTTPGYAVFGKVADDASLTTLESFKNTVLDAGTTIPTTDIRISNIYRTQ